MAAIAPSQLSAALRRRSATKGAGVKRSVRIVATVRPCAAGAAKNDDNELHHRRDAVSDAVRFAAATLASVAIAMPAAAAPIAELAAAVMSPQEQIEETIAKFAAEKEKCSNSTCRDTQTSWENAAVLKIKKKAGLLVAPAPKVSPIAPKVTYTPTAPV
eukprot:CAMPEP_0197592498 /NCGR_PEP_ID=MMETSP1326-20131121/15125_1 /TAXON_ID=1155430 /ORGANISM="Genus nov. species nov., Strain RCC2288" /LENGTH=158 /DNA_ID=CAMNT_0043158199 /DNA_START=75 /DNA_END=548 /DNA_ORIENTATION=-